MSRPTVVFTVEDFTSLRCLQPVARNVSEWAEVEFLAANFLLHSDPDNVVDLREDIEFPTRDVREYVSNKLLARFPDSLSWKVCQRLLLDHVSPEVAFDVDRFLADADPDLFVAAVDQLPFIRHVIHRSNTEDYRTAVVQHGTYEFALDHSKVENRLLFPNFSSYRYPYECLKRRIGFKYGATMYAHPDVDVVTTLGDFFTGRIQELRNEFPYNPGGEVVTAGSPEFGGEDQVVQPFDPGDESALFLSQQQVETDIWGWDQQKALLDRLSEIDDHIPVTVRPHPKDSERKRQLFKKRVDVSQTESLAADVRAHDVVFTVDSTALFEAVIQGKVCGVVHPPSHPVSFPPFVDDHIVDMTGAVSDLSEEIQKRDEESQQRYLDQFCYMPDQDTSVDATDSTELIAQLLEEQVSE